MNNYESDHELNIINFIKVCRFCDNLRKSRSLTVYTDGLDELKVCSYCQNEIYAIKNGMLLSRISRIFKAQKKREAKQNVVIALRNFRIGIPAGIHQNILNFLI